MSTIWVLGSDGLVGRALQKLTPNGQSTPVQFLNRQNLEVGAAQAMPFKKNDIVIDLVPIPYPREIHELSSDAYHHQFSKPHADFIHSTLDIGIKKYIFISSGGAVYGRTETNIPFKETDSLKPVSLYGEGKIYLENALIRKAKKSNIPYTILRCSNIFNEDYKSPKQPGLIGAYLKAFRDKQPIDIFGKESITKDYIASIDVARAIITSIQLGNNEIINIGSGVGHSISEIITAFQLSSNFYPSINYKPEVDNDVFWFVLNTEKSKKILNFDYSIELIPWIKSLNFS